MNRRAFITALAVLPIPAHAFVYYKKEHHRKVDVYSLVDGQWHHKQFFANRSLEEELHNLQHGLEEYKNLKQGDYVRMETSTQISSHTLYMWDGKIQFYSYTINKK